MLESKCIPLVIMKNNKGGTLYDEKENKECLTAYY